MSKCMNIVNTMAQQDQDKLLERLEVHQAAGMAPQDAQRAAAQDVLNGLQQERRAVLMSRGEGGGQDQTETAAFKAWFGDWKSVITQNRLDAMPSFKINIPSAWRGKTVIELREMMARELDRMVKEKIEIKHPELGVIRVGRRGAAKSESTSRDPAKMLAVSDVENALPTSIVAGFTGSTEQGVDGYTKLLLPIEIDGHELAAIFTVRHQTDGSWYYNTVTVADNKKGPGSYESSGAKIRPLEQTPITGLASFIRQPLNRVKPESVSKVIDFEGRPLVVYHGSKTNEITEFNTDAEENPGERGTFFSAKKSATKDYGSSVYEAYLSIKNPYEVTSKQWAIGDGMTPVEARKAGHDGYIIRGLDGKDGDAFMAFSPTQIKSTTNNGQFDPANPDIRYSRATGESLSQAIRQTVVTDLPHQFGNRLADFRGLGLQALGRRQLVDIYAKDLPALTPYSRMVAQMDADKNESGAEADALAVGWGKLKDERQLAELMHDATLAQMDPDKAFVEGDDENHYEALKHGFDALTPEAKAAYREARDMYSVHNDKVREAIRERIMRSELNSAKKQALLEKMDGEFFKKVKGVYFPLARFGQYVTIVKDGAGNVVSSNRSETMNEAEATRKTLLAQFPAASGYRVGKVLKDREFNAARDGVGRGFMADLFETLENTGAGDELMDSISQLYLAALPDLSWAKHGIHRKGTPGFSQDARRAFAQNMFHGARYLAKLRYADQLQTGLDTMQEHIAKQSDNEAYDSVKAQQVVDEMVKRHDSMMNPQTNPLSTALTSFGFVFYLGLSPASALVNLSQTALVAYPIMGAKWGWGKASAALLTASKQAASGKNDISAALNPDERRAYDEAVRSGVIDVTMAHDLAGISQGEDTKLSAKIRPVMKWASFMFHHAEKFNRQVTFVAAYRLASEAGTAHDQAYAEAVKATYDGHFDYSATNRPRFMQGNWQKVLLLFKQYAQNMIYTLSRQAHQAIKAETPEGRKEARKALGGLLASHAMAAGVFGLPLVGMLLSAASALGSDDDEPWGAQIALQNMLADAFGQKPAEVFAHGLSRLTPWDVSGRVGLDKLLLPDVQEGLQGGRAAEAWMTAALGPVAGIGVNVAKGMSDMAEGHYLRGLESMLPTALRNPMKALRYGTEGNIDRTGVPINDEVSAAGIAGQFVGFSPSETRNAQEGKSAIVSADRAIQARRSHLVRQFAMAAMAQDQDGKDDARKDIARFNEKNPGSRITPVHLMQSVRARNKRIREAEGGVYLPKKRRDALEVGRFAEVD
jgi:hypothetical protein